MKRNLICGLAELIGTALLVFIGCMGCVASLGVVPSHLQVALTFGLTVMIVIQVSMQVKSPQPSHDRSYLAIVESYVRLKFDRKILPHDRIAPYGGRMETADGTIYIIPPEIHTLA